jgi:hypothetical protein
MTDAPSKSITVSDHAVLRFLERHHGIDVEHVRQLIGACCQRGVEAGAPVVRVGKARFLLRGRVVVTCYPDGAGVNYDGMVDLIREAGS